MLNEKCKVVGYFITMTTILLMTANNNFETFDVWRKTCRSDIKIILEIRM